MILGIDAGEDRATVKKFLQTRPASYPIALSAGSDTLSSSNRLFAAGSNTGFSPPEGAVFDVATVIAQVQREDRRQGCLSTWDNGDKKRFCRSLLRFQLLNASQCVLKLQIGWFGRRCRF